MTEERQAQHPQARDELIAKREGKAKLLDLLAGWEPLEAGLPRPEDPPAEPIDL